MKLIQLLLVGGFIASLATYLLYFRAQIIDRVSIVTFFLILVVLVLYPELTTKIAKIAGVGRGTDLVLYIFSCGVIFSGILLASKIKNQEEKITQLIRELAIREAIGKDNEKI